MRIKLIACIGVAASLGWGMCTMAQNNSSAPSGDEPPGIQVAARFIPVPKSVSAQAQAYLSKPLHADFSGAAPPDPRKDRAAYDAYHAAVETQVTAALQMMAKGHECDIAAPHKLSKFVVYEVTPKSLTKANGKRAILFLHSGGFTLGGGIGAAYGAFPAADVTKMRTFAVDYRMPPDYPFPAALDDAVETYQWLLARGYKAKNIAVYGSSAGGNLAAAFVLRVRDTGLPLPGAAVLHTPASDMRHLGDSLQTNNGIDPVLSRPAVGASNGIEDPYLGGHDPKDPYVSPVYGDFSKGFSPTILSTGTRDMLLSDTVRLHRALRRAGIRADLNVYEAMPHGGFLGAAPEDQELLEEHARFLDENLATK
jgi:epsilon-lactone hydrolase